MQPTWTQSVPNLITILLALVVPVSLIALGIWLALRLLRAPAVPRAQDRPARGLVAAAVFAIGLVWLLLSLNMGAPPGQSPLPLILMNLFFLLVYVSFYGLVIAGAVWLVLWLARRMGIVGPAVRETPLDILKARYARGEVTKEQFEEIKRDLGEP